jgi:hypothetical protein
VGPWFAFGAYRRGMQRDVRRRKCNGILDHWNDVGAQFAREEV